MKLRTNLYDLWIFHRCNESPEYLMYRTSQEKADKWFFGRCFWQIAGGSVRKQQDPIHAIIKLVQTIGLNLLKIYAVEYTYTYYNSRRKNIEIVPVFAAEVVAPGRVELSWEHSEYCWFDYNECRDRITYRGLLEGLEATRKYVVEPINDPTGLQLY